MSTTPLTDGIQALINYSNETTGQEDTTLSGAIDSLVSGFGAGGGSTPTLITTLEFDLAEDYTSTSVNNNVYGKTFKNVTLPQIDSIEKYSRYACKVTWSGESREDLLYPIYSYCENVVTKNNMDSSTAPIQSFKMVKYSDGSTRFFTGTALDLFAYIWNCTWFRVDYRSIKIGSIYTTIPAGRIKAELYLISSDGAEV